MNKTEKILVKISEDREELKKFLEQETMDDMYEFVLSRDSSISEEEFDESVAKLLEDYSLLGVEKVNEDTLVNVSGGAAEFGKKATSAGLAALVFLPLSAPSASATNPSEGQPSTSRFKKFVSDSKEFISSKWGKTKEWFNNHPALSSFVVTAATLATVIVVVAAVKYNKSTSEGDNKVLDSLSEGNNEAPGSLVRRRVSEVISPERKHEDEVDFEINLPVLTKKQEEHMSREQRDAYDSWRRIRYADKSGMTSDQLKKWKEDFVNAKKIYDNAERGVVLPAPAAPPPAAAPPAAAPPAAAPAPSAPAPSAPPAPPAPPPPPPSSSSSRRFVVNHHPSTDGSGSNAVSESDQPDSQSLAMFAAKRSVKRSRNVINTGIGDVMKIASQVESMKMPEKKEGMNPQQIAIIDEVKKFKARLIELGEIAKGIKVSEKASPDDVSKVLKNVLELRGEANEIMEDYKNAIGAVNDPYDAEWYMRNLNSKRSRK